MRRLLVIGIGAGNPGDVTAEAVDALNAVDVFFLFDKGERTDELARLRKEICGRFIKDRPYRFVEIEDPEREAGARAYEARVRDWHRDRAARLAAAMAAELPDNGCGAFLVWGDPSLYDSTLRVLRLTREEGAPPFEHQVIPGVSSLHALTARHKVELNAIGGSVLITTGRRLAEGVPGGAESIAVMLDSGVGLEALRHVGESLRIYWGAYLGTPDEILVSGDVTDVLDEILRVRAEKRAEKGWIMDTYLLRRDTDV